MKEGLTLIELLIVIFIIGVMSTLVAITVGPNRAKSRDLSRVADVKAVHQALESYHNDQGQYPASLSIGSPLVSPNGNVTYLDEVPSNPSNADGDCDGSEYSYTAGTNNQTYQFSYCLGSSIDDIPAGSLTAIPENIACTESCGSGGSGESGGSGLTYQTCTYTFLDEPDPTAGDGNSVWGDGTYIYTAGSDHLQSWTVDSNGNAESLYSVGSSSLRDLTGDDNFIYVVDDDQVFSYSVGPTGDFTEKDSWTDATRSGYRGLCKSGSFLYVMDTSDGVIVVLSINSETGALTYVNEYAQSENSGFPYYPDGCESKGNYIYFSDSGGGVDGIYILARDDSGYLSFVRKLETYDPVGLGGDENFMVSGQAWQGFYLYSLGVAYFPVKMAQFGDVYGANGDIDGNYVIVGSTSGDTEIWRIDSDGLMTQSQTMTLPAGLIGDKFWSDDSFLYVPTRNTLGIFSKSCN